MRNYLRIHNVTSAKKMEEEQQFKIFIKIKPVKMRNAFLCVLWNAFLLKYCKLLCANSIEYESGTIERGKGER